MIKQTMSLIAIFFIGTSIIFAQNPQGKGQRQGNPDAQKNRSEMNEIAKTKLSLSDEQMKQWDDIHRSYFDSLEKLRSDETLMKEEKSSKKQELRKSKDEAINAILSDDQKVLFRDLKKEMREEQRMTKPNARPGMGSGRGDGPNKIKEELNLSVDQSVKWDEIQGAYRQKIHEVMSDDSIDNELKHEKKNVLKEEMLGELMPILDEDQKAILLSKRKQNQKQ